MFCGNYILSGILDKCYIFIKNNKNVEVDFLTTPTFIIEPSKITLPKCKVIFVFIWYNEIGRQSFISRMMSTSERNDREYAKNSNC